MWRSFEAGAVVESLRFADAVLAAGAAGQARPVTRASVAATPEQLRSLGPNELVVTTTRTVLGTDEGYQQLLRRLDDAQVAAIAVQLDASDPLPEELVAVADRLAMPLITFPSDTSLAEVVAAVLDAALEAQSKRLERILDLHQRFSLIVLDGGGPSEVASTLHDVIGYPIAVIDSDGKASVLVPADAVGNVDLVNISAARQPIRAGDYNYGEVLALTDGVSLDPEQLVALERAAMAISVRLAQVSAVAEEAERFAALTLEELIAGHTSYDDLAERATSFGWDLSRPRAVLLASIDPPTDPGILPSALATIAASARATLGHDAIVWTRSTTIAALLAPGTDQPAERRRIAEYLRNELDERLRTVTVSIGVGRCTLGEGLPQSFSEASRAVEVGRWAKGRHVTEVYDQLGLERLLAFTPTDDLAEFIEHSIGPLVDHDQTNQTDLVETLEVWLETRNMAEAARRIHVHYNTFKNRLERIEGIIGPVVTDASRSLECEVAIYVARHYDGPWTSICDAP